MSEPHVEHVRPRLERLRKALRHWQIYSTEYETLRRELLALSPKASRKDVLTVGTKLSGKLIDEKEVKSLLGDELGITRTVAQVITEISHRIDYAQKNVITLEQQIERGENEINEEEEEEEDEYEDEDAKYKPTAEGLVSPELRMELEEFQKRIKERGEAARAEEVRLIAEEKNKPKKKRRGGVRFAEEPEEVSAAVPGPLPLALATKDTIPIAKNPGTNAKPEGLAGSKVVGVSLTVEGDEDAQLQYSIAEEARRSSPAGSASPRLLGPNAGEAVSSPPYSTPTPP